ncbi:MAG: NAD(P)/FAD-dependent oxidoreductase [Clostridia bacterium]
MAFRKYCSFKILFKANKKERYVNMKNFDVIIVGAGIAGICTAYELSKNNNLKICIFEQGKNIYDRRCPTLRTNKQCINCKECSIMKGFGGAGNFSDGKYNFTTEFGGWLSEYISEEEVMELINYVDSINVKFGATQERFSTKNAIEFKKKALGYDLHLLQADVKHLGTENNLQILKNMYEYLLSKDNVTIICNTKVESFNVSDTNNYSIYLECGEKLKCKYLVVAPGRSGAEWFSNQCKNLKIPLLNNQVDIGVRVEVPAIVYKDITDNIYEAKLKYQTKKYGDIVRTFCMNPNGYVVAENVDGLITVNGHSYSDPKMKSENTNFAILVSNKFTEPFDDPYTYGKSIASLSNLLGKGVIVQRFGDLMHGRRSNDTRMAKGFVKPTLFAVPGDLSLVLPARQLKDIIEMIEVLDKVAPGTANEDTLLYGVEVKFYSAKPKLTSNLEVQKNDNEVYNNFYALGDGAGVTRGLAQAGASGIHVARSIILKEKKN